MTGSSAHGRQPIHRWLGDRHHDLRDGLGRFLDPDAGLREVVLHAEHSGVLGGLGSRLDTEAGLAAILQLPPDPSQLDPGPSGVATAIAAADPAVRMILRRTPVVLAVIFSDLNVQALVIADHFAQGRDREAVRDLIRDLIRDLDRARARAVIIRGREFDAELASALTIARAVARDAAVRDLDLTHGLDRARFLGLDHALTFARDWARSYARGSRDPVRDGGAGDLNLDHAREIADREALAVGRLLGVRHVEGLAAALLDGTLDDFTHADLSHADLTGLDLTGVRWSVSGTRWPPETDVEALRTRSQEAAPDTGIYVIASPGDDSRARQLTLA